MTEVSIDARWLCTNCTSLNKETLLKCENCGHVRPLGRKGRKYHPMRTRHVLPPANLDEQIAKVQNILAKQRNIAQQQASLMKALLDSAVSLEDRYVKAEGENLLRLLELM